MDIQEHHQGILAFYREMKHSIQKPDMPDLVILSFFFCNILVSNIFYPLFEWTLIFCLIQQVIRKNFLKIKSVISFVIFCFYFLATMGIITFDRSLEDPFFFYIPLYVFSNEIGLKLEA